MGTVTIEAQVPQKFWMVHGIGKSAGSVRHATSEIASNEAARLARENPGFQFYVLTAVEMVQTSPAHVVRTTV